MREDPELLLLDAWRQGDRAAGELLFKRHFATLARFFRNKVSSEVSDLMQKTFLACVESREAIRGDSSFRAYLLGVAYNVLRNHLRSKRRKQAPIDFGSISIAALDPSPSRVSSEREDQRQLLQALRAIPLDYQVVLELHYWEQLDRRAIASILDIPPGTAASRIRRGRELLRDQLQQLADAPAAVAATLDNLDHLAATLAGPVAELNR